MYIDSQRRIANCNLSPEKSRKIIFRWVSQSCGIESPQSLDLDKKGWYFYSIFEESFGPRLSGIKYGHSEVFIQIDEYLLRGKRPCNRGRILLGDHNKPSEDGEELETLKNEADSRLTHNVTGVDAFLAVGYSAWKKTINNQMGNIKVAKPWILKWKRNFITILIRYSVERVTLVWGNAWAAHNGMGGETDSLVHESVNHIIQFVENNGNLAQNIDLIENMKGNLAGLLKQHVEEFMSRSRQLKSI
ncbi:hypothetical protein HZS_950 [Henneguya salminicola]|nr:hypothetical protein HZS_950 [Henneguya salminicola]